VRLYFCGHPFERGLSFSDARSGQVVDERIRPALESGSAVGCSKPVLVVIDEIDGATGAGDTVCS
jgi:chromosome transmission fidelity protein 18